MPRTAQVLAYAKDTRTARYWQKKIGDMDYEEEDKLDTPRFNHELWKGMMGEKPYPSQRSGANLRENLGDSATTERLTLWRWSSPPTHCPRS